MDLQQHKHFYSVTGAFDNPASYGTQVFPFSGFFLDNPQSLHLGGLIMQGLLVDRWGKSEITGAFVDDGEEIGELVFDKVYEGRPADVLEYTFVKKGGLFVGNWKRKGDDNPESDNWGHAIARVSRFEIADLSQLTMHDKVTRKSLRFIRPRQ